MNLRRGCTVLGGAYSHASPHGAPPGMNIGRKKYSFMANPSADIVAQMQLPYKPDYLTLSALLEGRHRR